MTEQRKPLVILKLGGSVLTYKDRPFTPNMTNLGRLAGEIGDWFDAERNRLVLVHGAGSFGHPIAESTSIHEGVSTEEDARSFAVVQRWQNQWNVIVTETLQERGIPAMPVQASSHAVMRRGRLVSFTSAPLRGLLGLGMVPVLYGVPAFDEVVGSTILSGDQIVAHLGEKLSPERVVFGTDVDGLSTADPKKESDAVLIELVDSDNVEDVRANLARPVVSDVTGGMLGKFDEIVRLARTGVRCMIVNAGVEGRVGQALRGQKVTGTLFHF